MGGRVAIRWGEFWVEHEAERCEDCGRYVVPTGLPGFLRTGSEARRKGTKLLREHEVCSCAGGVGVVVYGEGQEVTEQ